MLERAEDRGWAEPHDRHDANDRAVRLADVVIAWNIFQHFYPYFEVVKAAWPGVLSRGLVSAAVAPGAAAFCTTLQEMVAALHDGHGTVCPVVEDGLDVKEYGILPIALCWTIEGLVVANVSGPFAQDLARGDAIVAIDGRPVAELRREMEGLLSAATPQYFLERVQAELVTGAAGRRVVLEVEPFGSPGARRHVTLVRQRVDPSVLPLPVELRPDKVADLRPGVVYVDLTRLEKEQEWVDALPKMQGASAITFDVRGFPGISEQFLRYLFDKPFKSGWQARRAIVLQPDGNQRTFESGGWDLTPLPPYLGARKIFLTDARAMSSAESVMGYVEHHHLGDIGGGPTAGTNGNAIITDLPGGYRVMWTGMQVVKGDGSPHHGVGILPTVPVSRTRTGIAAGRDEVLERALALIDASPHAR